MSTSSDAPEESEEPPRLYTRSCAGYVYFADQGIEVCESCGGCTCCDFAHVDHRGARYRCWPDRDGACGLVNSRVDHDCERDQGP